MNLINDFGPFEFDECAWKPRTILLDFQRLVFVTGCFDALHRGHLELLIRAKMASRNNILLVGINSDAAIKRLKGPTRPINNERDRRFMLNAIGVVDSVMIIDSDTVTDAILEVKPAVWVKGGSYTLESLNQDEVAAARKVGARIEILPLVDGYSSTAVIERMKIPIE